MAQVINTNISSLNAQRNLTTSQNSLATSLQRLSSGLRINSAKDDAAGLAITDRMTSQIRGLNQAARNANDGVSLAQTAEGGLAEVGNNLQRIRELAVQSANATNTASDRASLQAEVAQLLAEIQRVSTTTQFNGQNILDGTFSAAQFQVGANANQTIIATTGNSQTSAIGSYQATGATAVTSSALASGDLLINGIDVGVSTSGSAESKATAINAVSTLTGVSASASTEMSSTASLLRNQTLQAGDLVINGVNVGAIAGSNNIATQGANIAAAINAVSNQTGVTATSNLATGALTLNSSTGKDIAITSTTGNAGAQRLANATGLVTVSGTPTASTNTVAFANGAQGRNDITFVTDVADAQDGVTFTLQGRTYELDSGGGVTGSNIAIAFTTADTAATIAGLVQAQLDADVTAGDLTNVTVTASGADVRILSDVMTATTTHTDVTTTLSTTYGVAAAGAAVGNTVNVGGVTYEFGFAGATPSGSNVLVALSATDAGLGTNFAAAVNAQYTALNTNIQASGTATVTLTSDLLGSGVANLAVTEVQTGGTANAVVGGTASAGTDGTSTGITGRGTLELNSASQYILTGNDAGKAGLATASVQLTSLSSLSILTVSGANQAISLVDGALSQVASIRGNMGALQNRFQSVVGSLTASSENLSAARSRIQDADFAAETANLTRAQILQQAGVAMLAQANALPNNVLTLLRG